MQSDKRVHILPAEIRYEGAAQVGKYFESQLTKDGLVSSFRGRKLVGERILSEDIYEFVEGEKLTLGERLGDVTNWQRDVHRPCRVMQKIAGHRELGEWLWDED